MAGFNQRPTSREQRKSHAKTQRRKEKTDFEKELTEATQYKEMRTEMPFPETSV